MPFNSGNYTRPPGSTAVAGDVILDTTYETALEDIKNAFNATPLRDGSVAFSGAVTVPNGTAPGHAVNKSQLDAVSNSLSTLSGVVTSLQPFYKTTITTPVTSIGVTGLGNFSEEIVVRFNALKPALANTFLTLSFATGSLFTVGFSYTIRYDWNLDSTYSAPVFWPRIDLSGSGANSARIKETASGSGVSGVMTIRPRASSPLGPGAGGSWSVDGRISYDNNSSQNQYGTFSGVVLSSNAFGGILIACDAGGIGSGSISVQGR